MFSTDHYVWGMAVMRLLSSCTELVAALLMLRLNRVEDALRVNAVLGLVGPFILILVTAIGVMGMAERLSFSRLGLIFVGVIFILAGTR